MAERMTDEGRLAVAERLYAAHYLPPREGAVPLVSGFLHSDGTVGMLASSEAMPYRGWPSEEAFARWAAALGVECDVRRDFGDGDLFCLGVAFPDGVVVEIGHLDGGRQWPNMGALLEEAGGRYCCVYRWRPVPGDEAARMQARDAAVASMAVDVLANRLAELGARPRSASAPKEVPWDPDGAEHLGMEWRTYACSEAEKSLQADMAGLRTVTPAKPEMKEARHG